VLAFLRMILILFGYFEIKNGCAKTCAKNTKKTLKDQDFNFAIWHRLWRTEPYARIITESYNPNPADIRQATIPYHDALLKRDYTPLQCVERVWAIEALADALEKQWRPRVDFEVRGLGRWQHELSICVPSTESLAKIQERRKTFAALGFDKP
jgi:hypothetical protein